MAMRECLNLTGIPYTRVSRTQSRCIHNPHPKPAKTTSFLRMSISRSSSGNKSHGSSGSGTVPKNSSPIPRNRFQKSGNQEVWELRETKDSVIYRVDLPGCPASDLMYWIDGNNLHFFADEPAMPEYDHDGRRYGGTMVFNPVAYNVKEATARLRDGVLWITVPKVPGVNIKLTVIEKMLNCKITRDDVVG